MPHACRLCDEQRVTTLVITAANMITVCIAFFVGVTSGGMSIMSTHLEGDGLRKQQLYSGFPVAEFFPCQSYI